MADYYKGVTCLVDTNSQRKTNLFLRVDWV